MIVAEGRRLRSQAWFGGKGRDSFIHRSWMKNHGEPADSFDGRPVIVDVGTLPSETPDVASLMHAIVGRGIHIIGMEGAHPTWRGLEAWGRALPGAGKPGHH